MRDKERSFIFDHRHFYTELMSIPHLPLGKFFSHLQTLERLSSLNKLYPHQLHPSKGLSNAYYRHHEFSFKGQVLYDFQSCSLKGMADAKGHLYEEPEAVLEEGRLKFFSTPLGESLPELISFLKGFSPYLNRTRFISTPHGGGIPWHSHHNGLYETSYPRLAIVHLPLQTNMNCRHRVYDFKERDQNVYEESYQVGHSYLFNSWHLHEFWNQGHSERLTIIAYFNFADPELMKNLIPCVETYSGPRIKTDLVI